MTPAVQPALRMEWGLQAAETVAPECDVAVVVDVLSFTTTVTVALDLGVEVLPYRWADENAADVAAAHDATLAVGRSRARPGQVSLSPSTVRAAGPELRRLVLPSPNGATTAHGLRTSVDCVLAASLRNAEAVASWVTRQHGPDGARVLVVVAGEQAADAYDSVRTDLARVLHGCASGRELAATGFSVDVDVAAEVGRSMVVPGLVDGTFRDAVPA